MCMHVVILTVKNILLISIRLSSIEILSSSNAKKWKQNLEITLGIKDLDLALRENPPTVPNEDSLNVKKEHMKNGLVQTTKWSCKDPHWVLVMQEFPKYRC